MDLSKLRWRCRRGMRELDALLVGWLDNHYDNADDELRSLFQEILNMQDPEIMDMMKEHHSSVTQNLLTDTDQSSIAGKDARYDAIIKQICKTPTT